MTGGDNVDDLVKMLCKDFEYVSHEIKEDICCKGRKSNPSITVKAAGSSVAV